MHRVTATPDPAPPPASDPPKPHCCRLSEELEDVLRLSERGPVTGRVLIDHLSTRGHALLAFFLVLPFLQPIPLPGFSTPIGLAIAVLGVLMTLGRPPWLPRRWLDRELPPGVVLKAVRAGQKLLSKAERIIRPRGKWFHSHPWTHAVAGGVIAVSGVELALPLPILFTNTMPALVIAITTVGLLEEDAVLVVTGGLLFVAVAAVFFAITVLPLLGLHWLL